MFTINGVNYKGVNLDVNAICDFEEMGLYLETMTKKPLSLARGYLSLCMGKDVATAGMELNKFLADGGSLEVIIKAFGEDADKSDFFRSLKEKSETENAEGKKQENS